MVRITEMPNLFKNDGFIDSVTKYNNTQTAVKISDFRSNDKIQISIANYFSSINNIDGKKYFYKNKRNADDKKRNVISIPLDDFCRKIFAFLHGPIDFHGGQKYLYDNSESGGYFRLFGDPDENEISESLSKDKFNFYAAIFFICETSLEIFKIEKLNRIKQEKELINDDDKDEDKTLISESAYKNRYLLYYLIGIFIDEIAKLNNNDLKGFLISHSFHKPKVWRKHDKYTKKFLKQIVSSACDVWYAEYKKSYDSGINHRNWSRDKKLIKSFKNEIALTRRSSIQTINDSLNSET